MSSPDDDQDTGQAPASRRHEEQVGTSDSSGEAGLFGSNMAVAAAGELVGTFLLIFSGTAVAVAAGLSKPTAGAANDSLAVALGFGPMLVRRGRDGQARRSGGCAGRGRLRPHGRGALAGPITGGALTPPGPWGR